MPDRVTAQLGLGRFPAAERRGGGGQSRRDAEVVQQPIGVEAEQVLRVAEHGVTERPVEQLHVLHRERLRLRRRLVRDLHGDGVLLRRAAGGSDEGKNGGGEGEADDHI